MSTVLVNTLTATVSRLKVQLAEKNNTIEKMREQLEVKKMEENNNVKQESTSAIQLHKDETIAQQNLVISKLRQEIDNLSTNGQLQLEQSEWLNSIIQEKENVIASQHSCFNSVWSESEIWYFVDLNTNFSLKDPQKAGKLKNMFNIITYL